MSVINNIISNAKKNKQKIILPESDDLRILQAANKIMNDGIASIILVGNRDTILKKATSLNLRHIQKCEFVDPNTTQERDKYIDLLYKIRSSKGLTLDQAATLVNDPLYLATLMIKSGDSDGEVAGAVNTTGNVLRPALQIIKPQKGISSVSGANIVELSNKRGKNTLFVFADCAVNPDPTAAQLAEIAVLSAETASILCGYTPKVAMLSFSTKGSAKHPLVDKVVEATAIAQTLAPHLQIDGELQADAAIIEEVGSMKAPNSDVAGSANVLVFPNLECGNIAYKLVERLAGATVVGPILQGLAAPVNDLSRGCSAEDIYNVVAITALQAINLKTSATSLAPQTQGHNECFSTPLTFDFNVK